MSNLREDKGFCYGVYSSIASFLDDAYLCIATEVGIDVTAAALHEIEVELNRLQNYLVSKEELEAAINYRMGVFLSDNDGAFNQHEMLKGLLLFGADKNYLTNYIHTLRHATAKDIREMACKYFDFNSMHKIIAGKM
jgi:predicted Zn-dependent peptidase